MTSTKKWVPMPSLPIHSWIDDFAMATFDAATGVAPYIFGGCNSDLHEF